MFYIGREVIPEKVGRKESTIMQLYTEFSIHLRCWGAYTKHGTIKSRPSRTQLKDRLYQAKFSDTSKSAECFFYASRLPHIDELNQQLSSTADIVKQVIGQKRIAKSYM